MVTVKINGYTELIKKFNSMRQQAQKDQCTGVVGYTAQYAIYVHENLEARHTVGQAKYLERPAKELFRSLPQILKSMVRRGLTLVQAVSTVCLKLQRDSQELCPVQYGFLRASAFTRIDKDK